MHASQTHRQQDINFGDRTKLTGSTTKTLAWMNLDESASFTVYADARFTAGPPAALPHLAAIVTIEWGAGAATVSAEYRIVGRLRVPLAASAIRVEGHLEDVRGLPVPGDVVAEVAAFIARGTDGETIPNAQTRVQSGAQGILSTRSERVLAVEGFNAGAGSLWVMLFEGPALPAAGAAPRMAAPAPAGAPFRMRPASAREFLGGVVWAASAAPLTFTPVPGAALYLEAEMVP